MLKLGASVTTKSRQHFNPLRFKNCIVWYDFLDKNFIYSDAGTTKIVENAKIYRIDNKAYIFQKNDTKAIGKYLENSDSNTQPRWKSPGYCYNDTTTFLKSTATVGNVSSNTLSDSTINYRAFTLFVVAEARTANYTSADRIFGIYGPGNADWLQLYAKGNTGHWRWGNNQSIPKVGNEIDSGIDVDQLNLSLITINSDSASSNDIYVNGRTSSGVNNAACVDHSVDLSGNSGEVVYAGRVTGSDGFNGNIQEIIMYNGNINRNERYEVEKYLMLKHGIGIHNSKD